MVYTSSGRNYVTQVTAAVTTAAVVAAAVVAANIIENHTTVSDTIVAMRELRHVRGV